MYKVEKKKSELFSSDDSAKTAEYLYQHLQYKNLDMVVLKDNNVLDAPEVQSLIELHYPEETKKINEKIKFEDGFVGKSLIKFNILAGWHFDYFKMVQATKPPLKI